VLEDELRYKLLKALEQDPNLSQREMAKVLGVSLGKANFCINALVEVGWVKAKNFKNSTNKLRYAYVLTPKGIDEKSAVTKRFLQRKIAEYEDLQQEIHQIKADLDFTEQNI